MIRLRFALVFVFTCFAWGASARAVVSGVDSGFSARELIRTTDAAVLERWGKARPWIRIRGLPDPSDPKRAADVEPEREALARLKAIGFKPVPFIRWAPASWANGVRRGGGQRLPVDLREAYARAKRIAETYGEVVTALEFENEPDINFVEENAETYAAFQKACYLGVRAADVGPSVDWLGTVTGVGGGISLPVVTPGRRPLAIMAPLALPPGPFFEQLTENRLWSYTDAFNYHYYGHADDFSRVYRQFEDALRAIGNAETLKAEIVKSDRPRAENRELRAVKRRLPVMLTEYGFSGVSGPGRYGAEVRVDQWRWFRSVGEQIRELRIAAPMAFYLRSFTDKTLQIEFGITAKSSPEQGATPRPQDDGTTGRQDSRTARRQAGSSEPEKDKENEKETERSGRATDAGALWAAEGAKKDKEKDKDKEKETEPKGVDGRTAGVAQERSGRATDAGNPVGGGGSKDWVGAGSSEREKEKDKENEKDWVGAGGLVFRPDDFGAEKVELWMEKIGAKVGGSEALPALAWLWDAAERNPYRPRDWEIEVAKPSPIVIDLVAGAELVQLKRYSGYMISTAEKRGKTERGAGEFAVYNFSEKPVRGKLRWEGQGGARITWTTSEALNVGPGERVTVPFEATSDSDVLAGGKLKVHFEPDAPGIPPAVLATHIYPSTAGMSGEVLERFDHAEEAAAKNRELLLTRPRASDERELLPAGRWLTSPHARVEERASGHWRLVGTEFRRGPRVGRATFELPLRDTFLFPDQAALRLSYRLAEASGVDAGVEQSVFLEIYIRTENGNLFVVWPWVKATSQRGAYLELKNNFSMMFQSRANLPWRFAENRPVSLVFSFYSPSMDSAVMEIRGAEIVRIKR